MTTTRIAGCLLGLILCGAPFLSAARAAVAPEPAASSTASASPPAPADAPPFRMKTYYFALIRRGPKWTPEVTDETRQLQAGHMANIGRMAEAGKLVVAGPFLDGGDLRGIFIFETDTMAEAQALAAEDPAVKAGRLALEFHPWMSPTGLRSDGTPPKPAPAAPGAGTAAAPSGGSTPAPEPPPGPRNE